MAIAVILAGGHGSRFGGETPKQFIPLAGRPILSYSFRTFAEHPDIDSLIVTYPRGYLDETSAILNTESSKKPVLLIEGGISRAGSTRAALDAVTGKNDKILFHDAVRPFVTQEIISNTIAALNSHDAVDVVIDTADTIVQVQKLSSVIEHIPARKLLRRGQTPQGFWTNQLCDAYRQLSDAELNLFTDDCGVLLRARPQARIATILGSDTNIKITRPVDLFLAEQLLYLGDHGHQLVSAPLQEPVAFIFGDSSGLGLLAKEYLRKKGWRVFGGSRSTGVDVRAFESTQDALAQTVKAAGKIDVIANFAGILHVGPLQNEKPENISEVIEVNLNGSINVARASYPYLKKTRGHLIFCSSSSYFRGRKNTAAYSASKAAVVNLTQALADEWLNDEIAVSCLVPRRTDTPMRRKAFPDEDPALCLTPQVVASAFEQLVIRRQSGIVKHIY
jgi:2-C-methyl-D-erythritol 4-phosphate cytidylyltransferase